MYIYTIKDNDEPATGDLLAFLEAKAPYVNNDRIIKTYAQVFLQI